MKNKNKIEQIWHKLTKIRSSIRNIFEVVGDLELKNEDVLDINNNEMYFHFRRMLASMEDELETVEDLWINIQEELEMNNG